MTRDYRHGAVRKKQTYQRKSQQQPDVAEQEFSGSGKTIWLGVMGLSVALLVGFFVVKHFADHGVKSSGESNPNPTEEVLVVKPESSETESSQPAKPEPMVVETVSPEATQPQKIEYSFYTGLAETEVVVDVEPISIQLEVPYYILAGTFGSEKVARQEHRRLAKLGQELTFSPLTKKTRTYYRLMAGPFEDRLSLNAKRNELRALGVDTLAIKSRKKAKLASEKTAEKAAK